MKTSEKIKYFEVVINDLTSKTSKGQIEELRKAIDKTDSKHLSNMLENKLFEIGYIVVPDSKEQSTIKKSSVKRTGFIIGGTALALAVIGGGATLMKHSSPKATHSYIEESVDETLDAIDATTAAPIEVTTASVKTTTESATRVTESSTTATVASTQASTEAIEATTKAKKSTSSNGIQCKHPDYFGTMNTQLFVGLDDEHRIVVNEYSAKEIGALCDFCNMNQYSFQQVVDMYEDGSLTISGMTCTLKEHTK